MQDAYKQALDGLEVRRELLETELAAVRRAVIEIRKAALMAEGPASAEEVQAAGSAQEEIVGILKGSDSWLSIQEISDARGKTVGATRQAINLLVKKGVVRIKRDEDHEGGRFLYSLNTVHMLPSGQKIMWPDVHDVDYPKDGQSMDSPTAVGEEN